MRRRYRVVLVGDVQGVNLRWQIKEYAQEHELGGWVTNLHDGRVKLELEGEEKVAGQAVHWIVSEGAGVAQVKSNELEVIEALNETSFCIIK